MPLHENIDKIDPLSKAIFNYAKILVKKAGLDHIELDLIMNLVLTDISMSVTGTVKSEHPEDIEAFISLKRDAFKLIIEGMEKIKNK